MERTSYEQLMGPDGTRGFYQKGERMWKMMDDITDR
jgi:hypothetical protein